MKLWKRPLSFEWDEGNREKNLVRHGVTNEECEEIFFDPHKRMVGETLQAGSEERYLLAGHTQKGRALLVVFTTRGERIRVISARDLNRRERRFLSE